MRYNTGKDPPELLAFARCPVKYVLCVGEMLIDFIPAPVASAQAGMYQPHPGGAPANVAVALARLGGAARFIGKLSEDHFGRLLLRVLRENGVDTRLLPTTARGYTTLALVTLQEDGQREFTFYRQGTADTLLEPGDLPGQVWDEVVCCHAGSLLLASEPARGATLAALREARRRGLLTSFDVNARPSLWSAEAELRGQLVRAIAQVDLLKCSAEEAHYLDDACQTPFDARDSAGLSALAGRLLERGAALVVITRGSLGALLVNRQQRVEVPAQPVRAIDTTGAGDAFMGALLYRLIGCACSTPQHLSNLDAQALHFIATFANRAAALSCTRYGGIASLPMLADIEES